MNKSYVWLSIAAALALVPILNLVRVWPQLPAEVPIHFDTAGEADRMGDPSTLWILAGAPLLTLLFMVLLPRIDPKKQLNTLSLNFQKLVLVIMASTGGFSLLFTHAALAGRVDTRWMLVLLCAMWTMLGNYLGTVPPNYFAGIRTPWTLEDPIVWQRTHRVAGRAMVAAGLLGLPLAWLAPTDWAFGLVMGLLVAASLGPTLYSYLLWRQRPEAAA